MKLKKCLADGYIMGLKTVGEAYVNVHKNAHLYFNDDNINNELEELERSMRNYSNYDLITDILSKEEMDKIDKQLEEDLK